MRLFLFVLSVCVAFALYDWFTSNRRKATAQKVLDQVYSDLRARPTYTPDFITPEGAILMLEAAYRARDLEEAVSCKHFEIEAKLMLKKLPNSPPNFADDAQRVKETADALELSFRKHLKEAWPDMEGVESFFIAREPYAEGVVAVNEVCRYPDGGYSNQVLLVAETKNGWRVLNPLEASEAAALPKNPE
jgi:hypothetical protein